MGDCPSTSGYLLALRALASHEVLLHAEETKETLKIKPVSRVRPLTILLSPLPVPIHPLPLVRAARDTLMALSRGETGGGDGGEHVRRARAGNAIVRKCDESAATLLHAVTRSAGECGCWLRSCVAVGLHVCVGASAQAQLAPAMVRGGSER